MFTLIQIFICIILIIGIIASKNAKKKMDTFLSVMKVKSNTELLEYFLKSFRPIKVVTNGQFDLTRLSELKGKSFKVGPYFDQFQIDEIRIFENKVILFIKAKTYGYVGLLDTENMNYFQASSGKIQGTDITPQVKMKVFEFLNLK